MSMTIEENNLNNILKIEFERIFKNRDFRKLSNFKRIKYIFDYLVKNSEYDFSLLNNIYSGETRQYADEILSVLSPETEKRGVCNSFSYVYKILLDKLNIPCMLVLCEVTEKSVDNLKEKGVNTSTSMLKQDVSGMYLIPHMLLLVQNDDKTFSFDDITYAIFNKGTEKQKDYFNYDYQMAQKNQQINLEGFDTDMLRFMVTNSKDTQNDEVLRKKYAKSNDPGFLRIPIEMIKKYEISKEIDYEDGR